MNSRFTEKASSSKLMSTVTIVLALFSLLQISAGSSKQGVYLVVPLPFTKKLHEGQDFKYVCCAKRNTTILFRWGLYLRGSHRDPDPLYSRAEVKGTKLVNNKWSSEFKASGYKDRVKLTYSPKTLCMEWTIQRVKKVDENTFFGTYRDDQSLGKQFKPCINIMKLVVLKTMRPFYTKSTPTPPYPDSDTTPITEESHLSIKQNTDAYTKVKTSPPFRATNGSQPISDAIIAAIVFAVVILGIIFIILFRKRNQIRQCFLRTIVESAKSLKSGRRTVDRPARDV